MNASAYTAGRSIVAVAAPRMVRLRERGDIAGFRAAERNQDLEPNEHRPRSLVPVAGTPRQQREV